MAFSDTLASPDSKEIETDSQERPRDEKTSDVIASEKVTQDVNETCIKVEEEAPSAELQTGVRSVEAMATVWTKKHLIAAYILIWCLYLVNTVEFVIIRDLTPYVTSSFRLHSLTTTTQIVSNIVAGISIIPLAKVLDAWGRPQGMSIMLVFWVLGLILMASCSSVSIYAAAQVIFNVGVSGVTYCATVFIADTTSLKNRALILAYSLSPYVFITWIGGPIAQSVLNGPGWRWGFGIFTMAVPAAVLPLILLLFWNQRKAVKAGLIPPRKKVRENLNVDTVKRFAKEVDLGGLFLLCAGMALFLLPFSLYSYQEDKWRSPMIIVMIILGGLTIIAFALYEKFLAPVTFVPFSILMDRNVIFGGLMHVIVFCSISVWFSFFTSMSQVVYGLPVSTASYVVTIQRVGSCLWALVVGVLIRWTGRFKWLALYVGIPFLFLAIGLLVRYSQPGHDVGFLAMTQIFIAFAHGTFVITGEMCMMAPCKHEHLAAVLALVNLFISIGNATGRTISSALWTGLFRQNLERYLPEGADIASIYGDIKQQLSYPMGSPERDAINKAYGQTWRIMCSTSLGIAVPAIICIALWRDIRVKDIRQVKGRVV